MLKHKKAPICDLQAKREAELLKRRNITADADKNLLLREICQSNISDIFERIKSADTTIQLAGVQNIRYYWCLLARPSKVNSCMLYWKCHKMLVIYNTGICKCYCIIAIYAHCIYV